MNNHYRVGISGSYGGLNHGDEAILQMIIARLRASVDVEITVFTRNVEDTLKRHGVEHAVPVRTMTRQEVIPEVEKLDLFILGGGGILYDEEARIYAREPLIAAEKGIPVMTYAISAGPLKNPADQEAVRECLNQAAIITVREKNARQILEEAGVKKEIRVTADPALLLEPEPLPVDTLKREGFGGSRKLIAMSVREPGGAAPDLNEETYHSLLANVADFMIDRFSADILFIPMEQVDVQHSHAVIGKMLRAKHATVLKGVFTPGQVVSILSHCSLAVGMRLHFLIFAAIQGVPFVALPYATKVSGFLELMGIEMPPIQHVNAGRVIAHIDHSWDNQEKLRQEIKKKFEEVRSAAGENNELAVKLLQSSRLLSGK